MNNRSVKIIEATTPTDGLWESKMLHELLKMENVESEIVPTTVGWKTWFLSDLFQPSQPFVHICAHGEVDELKIGLWGRKVKMEDFQRINGGLADRVLTISACLIGRKKKAVAKMAQALWCDRIIAPAVEISFSDAAVFFNLFYYRLFSHRFSDKLRSRDSRRKRLQKVDRAFEVAAKTTKLKSAIRLHPFA